MTPAEILAANAEAVVKLKVLGYHTLGPRASREYNIAIPTDAVLLYRLRHGCIDMIEISSHGIEAKMPRLRI